MDFLDPKKKRAHRIRLMIGYVLMTIVVAIGTIILVYEAYGFGYNRETGEVVQNGLVFVDSAPVKSDIYINGKKQDSGTDARLVLPANQYKFELKREGYYDWQRSLFLEAGSLERLVYPMLIPKTLTPKTSDTLNSALPFASQSPDRRWILIQTASAQPTTLSFNEYDTTLRPNPQKRTISLPVGIVKTTSGTLKELEWSTDNRHLLAEYTTPTSKEFIVVDREDATKSFNINSLFSVTPTTVTLRDKKADQLYLLLPAENSLVQANVGQKTLSEPLIKKVLTFKPYGTDVVTYITDSTTAGTVRAVIWEKGQNHNLQSLPAGEVYVVDSARFDGDWYFVIGSNKLNRVIIYKNPLDSIKNSQKKSAIPLLSLPISNVQSVSFSATARFISAQSGQNFALYDIEAKDTFKYSLDAPLAGPMRWMDGHRLIGTASSKVIIMDFDGINRHSLVATNMSKSAFFDRDYEQMYVTNQDSAVATNILLQRVSMFSEADTPNNLK